MFIGYIYDKNIKAYELSDLKKVATRIANKFNNRIDEMIVDYEDMDGNIFEPAREKYVRVDNGKWKLSR